MITSGMHPGIMTRSGLVEEALPIENRRSAISRGQCGSAAEVAGRTRTTIYRWLHELELRLLWPRARPWQRRRRCLYNRTASLYTVVFLGIQDGGVLNGWNENDTPPFRPSGQKQGFPRFIPFHNDHDSRLLMINNG